MFMFSVRMHERYLFPAIPLVLGAFLALDYKYNIKRNIVFYIIYVSFSLMNLYNCAHVLFYYNPYAYDPKSTAIVSISAGTLVTWFILVVMMIYTCCKKPWISTK